MITRTLKAFAIAGALAGATLATAYAFQMPIDYHLNSAVVGGQDEGFDRVVFRHYDQMTTGGREVTFIVLLQAGADYRLAARCGTDCVDLNLSLRDAAGREVAADRSGAVLPGFNVRAPFSGAYVVTLEMASCRTPRCQVGAVVLGRSTPTPDA
ncbi:MAG TPA: hypothetical protein VFB68_08230 [Xanthobacteraceae bacterium]|nr:hypothetical protein [Xanthobacteraceae bacterium]